MKQAELIKKWQPWLSSTGPRSTEGKERVSMNAWRGGHRQEWRELSKMLNAELKQAKKRLEGCH